MASTPARRPAAKKPPRNTVAAKNATVGTARSLGLPTTASGAIDLLAVENDNPIEPLYISLDGDEFIIENPQGRSWQEMQFDPNNVATFLRAVLGPEDFLRFAEHPLEGFKVRRFAEALKQHFKLTSEDQGNGPASPTS